MDAERYLEVIVPSTPASTLQPYYSVLCGHRSFTAGSFAVGKCQFVVESVMPEDCRCFIIDIDKSYHIASHCLCEL